MAPATVASRTLNVERLTSGIHAHRLKWATSSIVEISLGERERPLDEKARAPEDDDQCA
jgi:hypothetical protein